MSWNARDVPFKRGEQKAPAEHATAEHGDTAPIGKIKAPNTAKSIGTVAPRLYFQFAADSTRIDYFSYFYIFFKLAHKNTLNYFDNEKRLAKAISLAGRAAISSQLLNLRFLAASDFFLRLTLGFS